MFLALHRIISQFQTEDTLLTYSLVLGDLENLSGGHCSFYPKENGIFIDVHGLDSAIQRMCGVPVAKYMFYSAWLHSAPHGIMNSLRHQFRKIGYMLEAAPCMSTVACGTAALSYDLDSYMITKGFELIDQLDRHFDTLVILSGDGDFLPLAERAEEYGKKVYFTDTHFVNSTIIKRYGPRHIIEIPTFSYTNNYTNKNIIRYSELS